MIRPLQRLTYFSRSLIRGPSWFVEGEISRFLALARERNRMLLITGALLFSEGCFAQILEGEAEDLNTLFPSIQADPRHDGVTLMQRGQIAQRAFAGWDMSYIGPTECDPRPPGPGTSLFQRLASVVQNRG